MIFKRIFCVIMVCVVLMVGMPFVSSATTDSNTCENGHTFSTTDIDHCTVCGIDYMTAENTPSKIVDFTVSDTVLIENYSGSWVNYNGQEPFFQYDLHPKFINIIYEDGTVIRGNFNQVLNLVGGFGGTIGPPYTPNEEYQSSENQWKVGEKHDINTSLHFSANDEKVLFLSCNFTLEIIECPVETIEQTVDELKLLKNYGLNFLQPYFDVKIKEQYQDMQWDKSVLVTYNGSTIPSLDFGIHTITVSCLGYQKNFEVEIFTPVESVEIADKYLVLREGVDQSISYHYIDGVKYSYYRYDLNSISNNIIVNFKEEYIGSEYDTDYVYVNISSDQSYDNQWEIGSHTVKATCLGYSQEFEVAVVENPIKSIEIIKTPDDNDFMVGEMFNLKGATLRVNYKDSTYEDKTISANHRLDSWFYSEKLEKGAWIEYENTIFTQSGEQTKDVSLFGKTIAFVVDVKENDTQSISIRNNDDKSFVLTLTDSDGNDTELQGIGIWGCWADEIEGGECYNNGALLTKNGIFQTLFYRMDNGDFYIEIPKYGTDEILQSNKLNGCEWFDVQIKTYIVSAITEHSGNIEHFSGAITHENIENIIEITRFYTWIEPISREGEYSIYDADEVRQAVQDVFDIKIDLNLSGGYNDDENTYTTLTGGGSGMVNMASFSKYDSGIWHLKFEVEGDTDNPVTTVYLRVDDNGKVKGYDIGYALGDVNESNIADGEDFEALREVLLGKNEGNEACNVNLDQTTDIRDLVALKKHLAKISG